MKKFYNSLSVIAIVALCNTAMAQSPTITAVSVPQVGNTYNMLSDTAHADLLTFTVSPGSSSAQTWNYTPMFNNVYGDVTSFLTPSSGQGSSNFPNSNVTSDQGGNWVYFKNTNGLMIDGAYINYQSTTVALDFVPDAPQLPVPITNGYSVNVIYSASATTTYSSIPVQVKHHANRTLTADAFGSLTTPTATYSNTLRVKIYETTIDSLIPQFVIPTQVQYDTTTTYSWYQPTQDALVMNLTLNKSGVATKAQYLQTFNNGILSFNQSANSLNLFPNPATDITYVTYENKTSGNVNLQLLDLNGRQIAQLVNENQPAGKQMLTINIGALNLSKGLYFLQLTDKTGLQTIKLNIN